MAAEFIASDSAVGHPPEVWAVDARLRAYGTPGHHNKPDPLHELIFVILSAQTEEYTYLKTYDLLLKAYPDWEGLAEADLDAIQQLIRAGGLYRKKAIQVKAALAKIVSDAGRPSLDFLREGEDDGVYHYLVSLPGVAHKSAQCIMMYSLGRAVFPVDTHVWRISRRLGWAKPMPKPDVRQERELEARIPAELRYSLHVNMVAHGRAACVTYWPKCQDCVLSDLCPSYGKADLVWGDWRRPAGVWSKAVTSA